MIVGFLAAWVVSATPAHSVYALPAADFVQEAKADLRALRVYVDGMRAVVARVAVRKPLFSTRRATVYDAEEKSLLLSTWGSLFAYFSATEAIRQKYWGFVTHSRPGEARHAWGFILTHTALTALLAHGLAFAEATLGNKQLETLFDEANPAYGVPQRAFAQFKSKAIHVATATQLMTGDAWTVAVQPALPTLHDEDTVGWAWGEMQRDGSTARNALKRQGLRLFAGNATDIAKDSSARALFPVQRTVAEWAGDTRVARRGKPLITAQQRTEWILPALRPGDVMVSRQNWFVSNIGLPGFWPHALLYVGTPEQLVAAFDTDATVKAWALAQPEKAATFSALLAARHPKAWSIYAAGKDFQGHGPIVVIEAISEGVSLTAAEHAFGVDYLAAMRPRLPPLELARAIERAFSYVGRPYDFDFDFFSDASLVCTEVVFKSYQPGPGVTGLPFTLVDVAGRKTLPANDLVRQYDAAADGAHRTLDFVLFVDAREGRDQVFMSNETALRASWQRVKWDVALE